MLNKYDLFWAPEGKRIDTVEAKTEREAIRKAPQPYVKFKGEIYAQILPKESTINE